MSFYNDHIYPNLISEKTINKISKAVEIVNDSNNLFSNDIFNNICIFISNNIIILIIIISIFLILCYRYNDVQKKKASNK